MASSRTKQKKKRKTRPGSDKTAPDAVEEQKFAIFSVGKEMFGLDLNLILETLYTYKVITVAHLPDIYKGVIKIKGQSIPIVMLRELLHEDPPASSMQTCIVVRMGISKVGFVIDSDIEIIPSTVGTLHALPDNFSREEAEFIKNIFWLEQTFIGILDPLRMMEILAGWKEGNEEQ